MSQHTKNDRNILLGISGGQDSLCLLKLLLDCLNVEHQRVYIIYIDHQWKNSSKKHVQHMINIAQFIKIPIVIYQTKELPISENEARKVRYKILAQYAVKKNATQL